MHTLLTRGAALVGAPGLDAGPEGESGLDQVVREHNELRALFRKYDSATTRHEKADIICEVVCITSQHASAEERTLYPLLRDKQGASEGQALYDRFTMDDQVNKVLLAFLDTHASSAATGTDTEWRLFDATARKFMMVEEEHLSREEEEAVDRLRVLLTPAEKDSFTTAWRVAKATAPLKPHPEGPSRTPWAHLAHPAAAGLDTVVGAAGAVLGRARETLDKASEALQRRMAGARAAEPQGAM